VPDRPAARRGPLALAALRAGRHLPLHAGALYTLAPERMLGWEHGPRLRPHPLPLSPLGRG
jgi:hypothetical protein